LESDRMARPKGKTAKRRGGRSLAARFAAGDKAAAREMGRRAARARKRRK
jgi:hypothetical protein